MLEIISSYVGSLLIDQEIIRSLSVQTTKIKNTNGLLQKPNHCMEIFNYALLYMQLCKCIG